MGNEGLFCLLDRIHGESGYMSSPERGAGVGAGSGRYPPGPYSGGSSYEDPYYSQYSGTVTPVIDEEARYVLLEFCGKWGEGVCKLYVNSHCKFTICEFVM